MNTAERPEAECIDVSGLRDDAAALEGIETRLRQLLHRLRQFHPQLPGDAKGQAIVSAQLGKLLREWAQQPDASLPALVTQLSAFALKGLGRANNLWPRIFVASPPGRAAPGRIDLAGEPRRELRQRLLALWQGYYQGRPETLEWIVAAIDAARPRSLAELHRRILRWDPAFLPFDGFMLGWAPYFSVGTGEPASSAPDWTAFWEKGPLSCYGERYPRSIQQFLAAYFAAVAARDPGATILDIGAGKFAASLAARQASDGFDIVGIDVAQTSPPPPQSRIRTLRMSAEALAFPDASFGAAVSVNSIEYADSERALLELFRVLRPGSTAALVLHHPDSTVLAKARQFLQVLEDLPIMETLALAWHATASNSAAIQREAEKSVQRLQPRTAQSLTPAFSAAMWDGIASALRSGPVQRDSALRLIEYAEGTVRWTRRKSNFLVERVALVASSRKALQESLQRVGFQVERLEELAADDAAERGPVGWGAMLRRPTRA